MDALKPFGDSNTWEFVERKDKVIDAGFIPKITDFAVLHEDGKISQDQVLHFDDYLIMVVSAGLDHTEICLGWYQ